MSHQRPVTLTIAPHTKINLKLIKDKRLKTVNVLEENKGEKLDDIGFGIDFIDKTPETQAAKAK
jgi:hypothetical protein